MIWAFSAFAASWTVAEPLVGVLGADGRVEQPAGVGFRIESEALPAVWDQAGAAVDLVPVEGGWLLPAADRSRALSIVLAHPERARFRRSDSPAEIGAWLAWDRAAWRAIHRGGPLPTPPSDSARTSASLRLRSAAVGPELAWLGLQADTAADRPWSRVSHVPGPELGLVGELTVQGPGFAILRVKLREGPLTRFVLLPTVDGQALDAVPLASTGAAPLSTRIWLPPGRHRIGARVEGATPETLSLQPMPLRPTLFRPVSLPALREGVDRAEWLWLSGHRAEAALAFAPFAEEAGPRGDLARARLLALAQDPAEAARRAAVEAGSPDGRELLADAALRVAELLDPETVARLVAGAADPDLVALARWLEDRKSVV